MNNDSYNFTVLAETHRVNVKTLISMLLVIGYSMVK